MVRFVQTIQRLRAALEFVTAIGVIAALLAVIASPVEGAKGMFLLAIVTVVAAALGSVALSLVLDVLGPIAAPSPNRPPGEQ